MDISRKLSGDAEIWRAFAPMVETVFHSSASVIRHHATTHPWRFAACAIFAGVLTVHVSSGKDT